jgi:hypothetical protein
MYGMYGMWQANVGRIISELTNIASMTPSPVRLSNLQVLEFSGGGRRKDFAGGGIREISAHHPNSDLLVLRPYVLPHVLPTYVQYCIDGRKDKSYGEIR